MNDTTIHYVDNKKFLQALIDYKKEVENAKETNVTPPQISNYIGECFIKIATHLSYKANFINYSFRDEMVSDGIENCLAVVENFDPNKSTNPFAYFTQIIYFAFVRRIQKEKKQQQTKLKMLDSIDFESIILQDHDEGLLDENFLDHIRKQTSFIEEPEKPKVKKEKKTKLPFQ